MGCPTAADYARWKREDIERHEAEVRFSEEFVPYVVEVVEILGVPIPHSKLMFYMALKLTDAGNIGLVRAAGIASLAINHAV